MRTCKICGKEKKLSEYTINKRSRRTGTAYYKSFCKACWYEYKVSQKGVDNSGRFEKGLIPWNRKEVDGRQSKKAKEWVIAVLKRDNHVCQKCNVRKKKMHSHHIKCWYEFPLLRFNLENGITLCNLCHAIIHGREKCNFLKNGTSWSKGKKMSKEHCKKLSEAHKGQVPWNKVI